MSNVSAELRAELAGLPMEQRVVTLPVELWDLLQVYARKAKMTDDEATYELIKTGFSFIAWRLTENKAGRKW